MGLRVVGPTRHGESASTFDVLTADGTDAVLKVHEEPPGDADAHLLLDCIVGPGYPAAIPIEGWSTIDGTFYELQPRLPGEPVEQITAAHLSAVRALNELQRGAAMESLAGHTWLDDVIRTVVEGADGYCEHDAMQRHSDATPRAARPPRNHCRRCSRRSCSDPRRRPLRLLAVQHPGRGRPDHRRGRLGRRAGGRRELRPRDAGVLHLRLRGARRGAGDDARCARHRAPSPCTPPT